MKTSTIISALAAIAAAAPFQAPTGSPALSRHLPPIPTGGPPFPPLSNNGSFAQPAGPGRPSRPFASGSLPPFPNGSAMLPMGTASMPMGTAPSLNSAAPLPAGTVSALAVIPPHPTDSGFMKRQFAGLSGIATPSGTSGLGGLSSLGSGSGLSGLGSGTGASLPSFSIPAGLTGFGTTGASLPSFSAPAGLSGLGSSTSSLGSSDLSGLSGSTSSIDALDLSSSGLEARGSDAQPLASLATPSNALSTSPPSAIEPVNAPLDGPAAMPSSGVAPLSGLGGIAVPAEAIGNEEAATLPGAEPTGRLV